MLTKGTGKDLPTVARRVERIEAFLAGFQRQAIITDVRGIGRRALDVLAIVYGKKASGTPFEVTEAGEGELAVGAGSYQINANTNTDVLATEATTGAYAYARVQQDIDGVLVKFEILVSPDTKEPTELNSAGDETFVEYSNILLAEVTALGVVQRRAGNLMLTTWVIDGYPALWADSTGGTINE